MLNLLAIARSGYCCRHNAASTPDRHAGLRVRITGLFLDNEGKCGYRPARAPLRQERACVSERTARPVTAGGRLGAGRERSKGHTPYKGETTPAPENIVGRNSRAKGPDEKWLTDITESLVPAGRTCLSPIIDRPGGMAASWTIAAGPNAGMADSMLEGAIAILSEDGRPSAHPGRGARCRRPGWIEPMDEACPARSMPKKGCSPDNSACEGFFGRTRLELFHGRDWDGVAIEGFTDRPGSRLHRCNEKRIKRSLGWMCPTGYRKSLGLAA